jgi:hypothetical protein
MMSPIDYIWITPRTTNMPAIWVSTELGITFALSLAVAAFAVPVGFAAQLLGQSMHPTTPPPKQ